MSTARLLQDRRGERRAQIEKERGSLGDLISIRGTILGRARPEVWLDCEKRGGEEIPEDKEITLSSMSGILRGGQR